MYSAVDILCTVLGLNRIENFNLIFLSYQIRNLYDCGFCFRSKYNKEAQLNLRWTEMMIMGVNLIIKNVLICTTLWWWSSSVCYALTCNSYFAGTTTVLQFVHCCCNKATYYRHKTPFNIKEIFSLFRIRQI